MDIQNAIASYVHDDEYCCTLLCCGDGVILHACAKYSSRLAANLLTLCLHSVILCKSMIPFCSSHCLPIKSRLFESFINQMSFLRARAVWYFVKKILRLVQLLHSLSDELIGAFLI